MPREDTDARVAELMARYGKTFAEELGIAIEENTPVSLFQLLVASLLFGARIAARNAARAARALIEAGLGTPDRMAAATWQERVDVITWHGYKRYDERTATRLGELAERVLERYGGDLRRLRADAQQDVGREKEQLMGFKGIGPVGADIFLREVQVAWPEVYPYADTRVLAAARRLGLGSDAHELAQCVSPERYAALAAALVRADLELPVS